MDKQQPHPPPMIRTLSYPTISAQNREFHPDQPHSPIHHLPPSQNPNSFQYPSWDPSSVSPMFTVVPPPVDRHNIKAEQYPTHPSTPVTHKQYSIPTQQQTPFPQQSWGSVAPYSSYYPAPMSNEHASPMDQIRQEQMILQEKRRRRRESHNAVERRRRDVINDRIQDLANLLPQNSIPAHKFNKGTILTQSVNYIKYLQDVLKQHNLDDHSFAAQTWDQLDLTNANFGSVISSSSVLSSANPSRASSHLLETSNPMTTNN